ncbi:MAG: PD-(D/E)XK motif protein [Paracoccaceae bacterium]
MNDTPWAGLAPDIGRRVDSEGRYDFFWAVMPNGLPGLLLRVPEGTPTVHPLPILRNLSLSYHLVDNREIFCISLEDHSQVEIFETLCRDVVAAAERAETAGSVLSRAIERTMRWHHLLRAGVVEGLSIEEQRGLVAELAVLRDLVDRHGALTAIGAWMGPMGSPRDFELADLHVEVKARRGAAHPKITISSAAQLAAVDGFALYLRVIDVDTALADQGMTLADHVDATAACFAGDPATISLWEQRLAATGYLSEQVDPHRVWKTGHARIYDVIQGFPRIVPPLPEGVDDLKYSVSLAACAPFEVADEVLSPVRSS